MRLRIVLASAMATSFLVGCAGDGSDADTNAAPVAAPVTTGTPATSTPATSAPATSTAATSTPFSSDTPTTEATTEAIDIALEPVAEVRQPVAAVARPGDDALYAVSQEGTIVALRAGAEPVTVVDLTEDIVYGGEQGLLGLAFSPDGTIAYVAYTEPSGDGVVEALPVGTDGSFDTSGRRRVYVVDHPDDHDNHNGGNLIMGPDGLLYIGTGDGGGSGDPERSAQDLSSPLGKILRIDPTPSGDQGFTVPADNPFVGRDDALGEIWSYGLRNPWRFSFDRVTGDLCLCDVGQKKWEEVDHVTAADGAGKGANFGWSAFEGTHDYNDDQEAPGHVPPLYEYPHEDDNNAVIGGFVYRGAAIPALVGAYLFADSVSGRIWALRLRDDGAVDVVELTRLDNVVSFGEDAAGELYVTSLATNQVLKIVPASA